MTNVPKEIRDAWTDIYKLFDIHYCMDGSEEAWIQYWNHANQLIQKYDDDIPLLEMCEAIAHMIEYCSNVKKKDNKILSWHKDEDYPHPRQRNG